MRSLAKSEIPATVANIGILAVSSHDKDSGVSTNNRFLLGFLRRRSFSNSAIFFLNVLLGLILVDVCNCLQIWKIHLLDASIVM